MTTTTEIQQLLERLMAALRRLSELQYDDDDIGELGPPCTKEQIRLVTEDFGMPLPPSYEAFLRLHNGWTDFMGEAPLLRVEDRHEAWYARRVQGIREHLASFGDPDFLAHGFLLAVHPDVSSLLYIDRSRPTGNGEFETVYHSLRDGEYSRHPSFAAFLEYWLASTEEQIAREEG